MDLYKILGVRRNEKPEAITKAYRKLSLEFHPDRNPGDPSAEEKYKEIQLAYEILSDLSRRAHYDATGEIGKVHRIDPNDDVISVLAPIVANILISMTASDQDPDATDFIAKIRTPLTSKIQRLGEQRQMLEKAKAKLSRIVGKFTVTDGDNLLQSLTKTHLADVDTQMELLGQEETKIKKALAFLDKCGCEFTKDKSLSLSEFIRASDANKFFGPKFVWGK